MIRAQLAVALVALLAGPALADEVEDAATAAAETAASLALNPMIALDKSSLDGFREAPLFTPSRTRPKPPPAPVVEAAAPPAPDPEPEPDPPADAPTLTLAGIAEGPEGAVAFVSKEGEKVEQLRLGDEIDGWLVTSIEPQSLKLTLDDREQEYRMFVRPEAGADGGSDDASSGQQTESAADEDDKADADAQEPDQPKKSQATRLKPPPRAQRNHNRAPEQE